MSKRKRVDHIYQYYHFHLTRCGFSINKIKIRTGRFILTVLEEKFILLVLRERPANAHLFLLEISNLLSEIN